MTEENAKRLAEKVVEGTKEFIKALELIKIVIAIVNQIEVDNAAITLGQIKEQMEKMDIPNPFNDNMSKTSPEFDFFYDFLKHVILLKEGLFKDNQKLVDDITEAVNNERVQPTREVFFSNN